MRVYTRLIVRQPPYKPAENGGTFDVTSAPILVEARRRAICDFCSRIGDNYQEAIELVMSGVPEELRWIWTPST